MVQEILDLINHDKDIKSLYAQMCGYDVDLLKQLIAHMEKTTSGLEAAWNFVESNYFHKYYDDPLSNVADVETAHMYLVKGMGKTTLCEGIDVELSAKNFEIVAKKSETGNPYWLLSCMVSFDVNGRCFDEWCTQVLHGTHALLHKQMRDFEYWYKDMCWKSLQQKMPQYTKQIDVSHIADAKLWQSLHQCLETLKQRHMKIDTVLQHLLHLCHKKISTKTHLSGHFAQVIAHISEKSYVSVYEEQNMVALKYGSLIIGFEISANGTSYTKLASSHPAYKRAQLYWSLQK